MDTEKPGFADRVGDGDREDLGDKDLDEIDIDAILSRNRPSGPRRQKPLYEAPEFVKRLNSFEEVKAGSDVVFECQWKGFPKPSIKWYKDDEEITPEDSRYQVSSEDKGVLKLCIEKSRKKDEGAYKCKVENSEGVTSTTSYLSVTGDYSDKPLSAQPRKNPERAISNAPHLRTIVEQKSLEEREAGSYDPLPPSPLQEFLNDKTGHGNWPVFGRKPEGDDGKDDDSGSETSVESQPDDYQCMTSDLEDDLRVTELNGHKTPEFDSLPDCSSESGFSSLDTILTETDDTGGRDLSEVDDMCVAYPEEYRPTEYFRFIFEPSDEDIAEVSKNVIDYRGPVNTRAVEADVKPTKMQKVEHKSQAKENEMKHGQAKKGENSLPLLQSAIQPDEVQNIESSLPITKDQIMPPEVQNVDSTLPVLEPVIEPDKVQKAECSLLVSESEIQAHKVQNVDSALPVLEPAIQHDDIQKAESFPISEAEIQLHDALKAIPVQEVEPDEIQQAECSSSFLESKYEELTSHVDSDPSSHISQLQAESEGETSIQNGQPCAPAEAPVFENKESYTENELVLPNVAPIEIEEPISFEPVEMQMAAPSHLPLSPIIQERLVPPVGQERLVTPFGQERLVPPGDDTFTPFPWVQYFAFTSVATFFASATEVSPLWFIFVMAVLSMISFRFIVPNPCT